MTVAKVAGMGMVWFPDFGWVNNLTGIGIRPREVTYDIQLRASCSCTLACCLIACMYLYEPQNPVEPLIPT